MLGGRQTATLVGIGAAFWLADAAWIRLAPAFLVDPVWGAAAYGLSVPLAFVCVPLGRRLAGLDGGTLVPGTVLLVAVAALLHAAALRWFPVLYGDDHTTRFGAAWLLWIYGLILGFAVLAGRRLGRQTPVLATPGGAPR